MDVSEKLGRDAESKRAEKFYEQALLLVDCCMIPEAIRLLEQAIQIKPDSEVYKESLEILQLNYLQTEQQGLSYANAARPKPNLGHGKENKSANQWNAKKTRTKESPTKTPWSSKVSSNCYNDSCEQSTIENPWASFLNSNSKRKKPKGSPIDGISEIEIPPIDDNFHTENPSYKQGYKHHDYQEQSDTPITCNGPQKAIHKDGMPVQYAQDNHVNASTDYTKCKQDGLPDSHFTNSRENLDTRFLEELCMARESAIDDWGKYYEVLCGGLGEEETWKQSDVSHHSRPTYCKYPDTLDEINETGNVRSDLEKDNLRSWATASTCGSDVCSKCGHSKESGNPPSSPANRIHFVNGACVSSRGVLNCTCNKEGKSCAGERTAKMPLSSLQQEFYHNLRYYFGSGKVKSKKAATEAENEVKSFDLHENSNSVSFSTCDTNVSSTTSKDDQPLNVESKQSVTESTLRSAKSELKSERKMSREHADCRVTSDNECSDSRKKKTSFSADQVKMDKKSPGDIGFHPEGYKKVRARNKVQSKTKGPAKTEHVKNSKEGISHGNDSQRRQSRVKDGVKSRGNHKGTAEDISRPMTDSEIREKRRQSKLKDEGSVQPEIDFATVFRGIYQTGVTVLSKCFQVSKSIIYYILLLLVLLFGFLIYCVCFAAWWLIKKVLYLTAAERLFSAARSKIFSLFEWLKTWRETRRKTSTQGQTYDLPKNGDAAIRHMLQNKDNDPYSVLGVPSDASDDDIRKQYRKLAVLIHPDKNPHSEADEAFKILANAFDILSDADKRREYDRESAWKKRAEEREGRFGHPSSPEQFFADLGKKMQEMQNYLHCSQCDGKHRRYSTDRFVLTARFCSRCNTRHAAKEGDLWAESSFLGYKLHFYACMEGEVYDVTEWAACQGIGNYRLEPNPHTVHLKLKTKQSHPSGFNTRSEEEDFENFMRAFFGQFNPSREERYHGSNKQPKKRKRKKR